MSWIKWYLSRRDLKPTNKLKALVNLIEDKLF